MVLNEERVKSSYHLRRKKVEEILCKHGISIGLTKRTVYRYPLNLLENLLEETEKRKPQNPADYFLNGQKRSRIRYGDFRRRDRKRKKLLDY
jgi:hypothetical protein